MPKAGLPNRSRLRSSASTNYKLPDPLFTTRLESGLFHMSACLPASWNSLPNELRSTSDTTVFKMCLKTHLFKLAFDI